MTAQCGKCSRRHLMTPCECPLFVADDPKAVGFGINPKPVVEPVKCDGFGVDGERCENATNSPTDWSWGILTLHKLAPDELHLCPSCLDRALRAIRRRGGQ